MGYAIKLIQIVGKLEILLTTGKRERSSVDQLQQVHPKICAEKKNLWTWNKTTGCTLYIHWIQFACRILMNRCNICGSHGLSRLSRWRRHYSETLENAYRLPAPGREQVPAWGQRCCSMLWRKNILHCLQLRGHGADRRRAVCVHRCTHNSNIMAFTLLTCNQPSRLPDSSPEADPAEIKMTH